jgi:hypothetical protein
MKMREVSHPSSSKIPLHPESEMVIWDPAICWFHQSFSKHSREHSESCTFLCHSPVRDQDFNIPFPYLCTGS